MDRLLSEVARYGLVSAVALAVDTSVLYVFVHVAGWHYLLASVMGFAAGAAVAYLLSVRFVFRFRQLHNPSLEFASFVALGLVGLLVNAAALFLAISAVGLGLITAKLFAAGCTFAANFTMRRQLLFAPPKAP
jgi:putative flippase GtrA